MILISHGSGGVGLAEYATAEYFLSKGYAVGINDYFSKNQIKLLLWSYVEKFQDNFNVEFYKMLTDISFPDFKKIVHIGFSLGGFLGILNHEKFLKNYSFYPGILGITENIIQKDYSNCTTFIAKNDIWCNDYYVNFEQKTTIPPEKITLDAYHGFMIPNKNRIVDVCKYHFPLQVISDKEFFSLKPNHQELQQYGFDPVKILLQSNENCRIIALSKIDKDLNSI